MDDCTPQDFLADFTLGEIGEMQLDELDLPIDQLLSSLQERNADIPFHVYNKLCSLCDELSDRNEIKIKRPKRDFTSAINTISLICKTLNEVRGIRETYWPVIKSLIKNLFENQ